MKYLKVFTDFATVISQLNDVEVGRLFRAMLKYAEDGTEADLKGNEKFLWGAAKASIDNQRDSYDKRCATNLRIATNRYESLRESTNRYETYQDKEKKRKDKDTEKESKKEKEQRQKCAVPPTLEEVADYVRERGSNVDPQDFIDFYAQKDWMVGRTKMADWKAACRRAEKWERYAKSGKKQTAVQKHDDALTDFEKAAIRRMMEAGNEQID